MTTRIGVAERSTKETTIRVEIDLDGTGKAQVATGIGFFDHMGCIATKNPSNDDG